MHDAAAAVIGTVTREDDDETGDGDEVGDTVAGDGVDVEAWLVLATTIPPAAAVTPPSAATKKRWRVLYMR
ncbi:hypothetical protein [Allobranchiibius sp. GilTou38]|uniref:hypothetical protein n=1 Tax=Allobranchiibius sp. GilTou38 TaxID=2815210 RepID=UPI001AA1CD62|nr:hypothetical protein [Allobranchiibius sp. GilTou38]MBO1768269.1 hypothetical protein [Allobranchiibius sp. GilTou38]